MKHLLMMLLVPVCLMGEVHRVFEYAVDGTDQAQRLSSLIQIPGIKVTADPVLGLVSIYGDSDEKVNAAEAQFRKFFKAKSPAVPDRNVEVTLQVLFAKIGGNESSDIPAILNPVLQQLKQTTMLTSFRMAEAQVQRVRSGKVIETIGVLPLNEVPESALPNYQFKTDVSFVGGQIRLENLRFGARAPYLVSNGQYQYREVVIFSSVDVKPGQFVVVGKTNFSPRDGALILVLSARLVD